MDAHGLDRHPVEVLIRLFFRRCEMCGMVKRSMTKGGRVVEATKKKTEQGPEKVAKIVREMI